MDKKTTKKDIEPQKADQTDDLQEFENPKLTGNHEEFTETPVTEITGNTGNIENQEIPVELPGIPVEFTEIKGMSSSQKMRGLKSLTLGKYIMKLRQVNLGEEEKS